MTIRYHKWRALTGLIRNPKYMNLKVAFVDVAANIVKAAICNRWPRKCEPFQFHAEEKVIESEKSTILWEKHFAPHSLKRLEKTFIATLLKNEANGFSCRSRLNYPKMHLWSVWPNQIMPRRFPHGRVLSKASSLGASFPPLHPKTYAWKFVSADPHTLKIVKRVLFISCIMMVTFLNPSIVQGKVLDRQNQPRVKLQEPKAKDALT